MRCVVVQEGDTYGDWTVLRELETASSRRVVLCSCRCGKESEVGLGHLRFGSSTKCKSCAISARNTTHGLSKHPLYRSWVGMKERCYYPYHKSYKNYGGRGIKVCGRWEDSFPNFLEDMGERPEGYSLDRVDNNGDYEPSNCKWSTPIQQANNIQTRKGYSSRYRGVSQRGGTGLWRGVVNFKNKTYDLGSFKDEIECHKAVEKKRNQLLKTEI